MAEGHRRKGEVKKDFRLLASVEEMCFLTAGDEETWSKISQTWFQKYKEEPLWNILAFRFI